MKQKKHGKCAICGKMAKLSIDHIPPKCCGNSADTYYIQYTPDYLGKGAKRKPMHSQNGLTFTHICENCNNIMGSKYDTHLQIFRDKVLSMINGQTNHEQFDLKKVCKSVVGHFLAASSDDQSTFAKTMRDYYLGDNTAIYADHTLLFSYYPYKNAIFSLNDYSVINLCGDSIPEGMLSSLYFFPFAFIFCQKQIVNFGIDLFEVCRNNCLSLRVSSKDWENKAANWPAIVDNGHAVIIGATANDSKFKIN